MCTNKYDHPIILHSTQSSLGCPISLTTVCRWLNCNRRRDKIVISFFVNYHLHPDTDVPVHITVKYCYSISPRYSVSVRCPPQCCVWRGKKKEYRWSPHKKTPTRRIWPVFSRKDIANIDFVSVIETVQEFPRLCRLPRDSHRHQSRLSRHLSHPLRLAYNAGQCTDYLKIILTTNIYVMITNRLILIVTKRLWDSRLSEYRWRHFNHLSEFFYFSNF